MSISNRSYSAGHFALELDGHSPAYLKSVDGGWMKHAVVDEPIGGNVLRVKHASVAEIDPVVFDFGGSSSSPVLKWISDSWAQEWSRRSGQITHADFNLNATVEHQFSDALITETTFPTLDGASKDAVYIKVKFQPEAVVTQQASGSHKLSSVIGPRQKMWLCANFGLRITGVDGLDFVNKIESFTIKQGVKKMYVGARRLPVLAPSKIEFPNISGTIAAAHAGGLHDWYESYVKNGQKDKKAQKEGSIEFLDPTLGTILFRVNLKEVGIIGLNMVQSTANQDQIKRMKFDLYVGKMELDGKDGMDPVG
jgi:hypothetical protein